MTDRSADRPWANARCINGLRAGGDPHLPSGMPRGVRDLAGKPARTPERSICAADTEMLLPGTADQNGGTALAQSAVWIGPGVRRDRRLWRTMIALGPTLPGLAEHQVRRGWCAVSLRQKRAVSGEGGWPVSARAANSKHTVCPRRIARPSTVLRSIPSASTVASCRATGAPRSRYDLRSPA